MLNFEDVEERDGVRLSWNVWPYSRIEATQTVVSISALYTPLKQRENLPPYTTIEYTLSCPAQAPPVFLFVVNTCLDADNLKALRDALVVSLSLIPPYALVGLIMFGTMTQVHGLGYAECSKSYVFRGGKEYTQKQIQDMLGLSTTTRTAPHAGQPMPQQAFGAARFLLPVQQCEFQLTGILEALARDPWPPFGLLETTFPNTGARIMVCAGGSATEGPGMVVSNELKEPIRSHHDIERDSVKHYKCAVKFYKGLAKRVSNNGHAVDLFAGCLDQVGLLEMKSLPNSTNGVIVLSDSFATLIFKQRFLCMFNKDDQDFLKMGFNATFDTTKELKVSGLIGHAISAGKKSVCVGETEIGIGQTSAWRINSITPRTSAAIYFEVVTPAGQALSPGSRGLIQFITHYWQSSSILAIKAQSVENAYVDIDVWHSTNRGRWPGTLHRRCQFAGLHGAPETSAVYPLFSAVGLEYKNSVLRRVKHVPQDSNLFFNLAMPGHTPHRTPLKRVSQGSFFALSRSGNNPDAPHGLGFIEPVMAELVDEVEVLQTNVEGLRNLSNFLKTFNESFASLLYVMDMNALTVDWPQAPTDASFRLAKRRAEENTRLAEEDALKAASAIPPPPDSEADKTTFTENQEFETTYMTNATTRNASTSIMKTASTGIPKRKVKPKLTAKEKKD
ncbi:uncharacterized protein HD556DRAFT_1449508 [Suillus plorans]|uniref:Protein transport protein SEC23 n=1 Tax=Suillus plorans TaxID=116603 RepID=A0A9P7ACS9_9AGAM|nr:uncharacterized protein HD556DRAFT_1449508 [Suillus plorans]KAG1786706.1 hypothetical protein HD556DRAFT_1449508 [Suillus plorans]